MFSFLHIVSEAAMQLFSSKLFIIQTPFYFLEDELMDKCIFCMIANKDINSQTIYETEQIISFLDINPVSKGHCLVVPKKHYADVFDIPETELNEIMTASKHVSELLRKNLGATGVNLINASGKDAQQSVFHFHMHIIPRYRNDGLDTWPKSKYTEKNIEEIKRQITK